MNLDSCSDQQLMEFAGARFASHRITPSDAAQFLIRAIITAALRRFQGNRVRTANWLAISTAQLDRHMKALGESSMNYHRPKKPRRKRPQGVQILDLERYA